VSTAEPSVHVGKLPPANFGAGPLALCWKLVTARTRIRIGTDTLSLQRESLSSYRCKNS